MAVKHPEINEQAGFGTIVIEADDGQDYEYDVPGSWSIEKALDYAFLAFEEEHPALEVVAFNDHWFL